MDWTIFTPGCVTSEGVATLKCIPAVFSNIVNGLLIFSGIVALFLIIFSGFSIIRSGGDPKQIDSAKRTFAFAIIGLIIILFSFFIINLISYFTGTTCITDFGFDTCK